MSAASLWASGEKDRNTFPDMKVLLLCVRIFDKRAADFLCTDMFSMSCYFLTWLLALPTQARILCLDSL